MNKYPPFLKASDSMNVIDIASWQAGIDLKAMFNTNPLDCVVVKATQGTGYVNTEYSAWVKWLIEHDKPFGVYHFANGQNAEAEARHFYNVTQPVVGKAIPILDYEADALKCGTAWVKKFVDKYRELSGVTCMIYCSLSVIHDQDWSALTDCPLWVAQYADGNPVYGFLEKPWQKGSVSPFPKYWMHQYTSNGRLNSWGGRLDLDKFYGTADDWNRLCGKSTDPTPQPTPTYKPVDQACISDILANRYGTGTERVMKLREAGYDPTECQRVINRLYNIAGKIKPFVKDDMEFLNSIVYIVRSL